MNVDDRISISTLLFLYTLQGIPMGLCGSLPLILKEQGASYEALSMFSLVSVPFSLKILWAPFVDTFYMQKIGRRKSWIIPTQLLTGIMMIGGSRYVKKWLLTTNDTIHQLTLFFTCLYFLMATQDVAVDGWALTMLSKEYVGWASISNSLGQTIGVFLANQVFLALSDKQWCSTFLGLEFSIDLPLFMIFWGVLFLIFTLVLWIYKQEKEEPVEIAVGVGLSRNRSHSNSSNNVSNSCYLANSEVVKKVRSRSDFSRREETPSTENHTIEGKPIKNVHSRKSLMLLEEDGFADDAASEVIVSNDSSSLDYPVRSGVDVAREMISDDHRKLNMMQTYRDIISLVALPPVRLLLVILLTSKFSFAPFDAAFIFKLQEFGMNKSSLATISPLFIAVNLFIPTIANETINKTPLHGFQWAIYFKLTLSILSVLVIAQLQSEYKVFAATTSASTLSVDTIHILNNEFPATTTKKFEISHPTTIIIYLLLLSSEAAGTLMFSSVMSFFSKISDPLIGGSSMTLFNTTMNLGSKWPAVISLYLIPKLTFTHCEIFTNHSYVRIEASCSMTQRIIGIAGLTSSCQDINGQCVVDYDGYCLTLIASITLGILWSMFVRKKLLALQAISASEWQLTNSKNHGSNVVKERIL